MNYNYNIENKSYISIFYFQNNSYESNPLEKLLLIEKKTLKEFPNFFRFRIFFSHEQDHNSLDYSYIHQRINI